MHKAQKTRRALSILLLRERWNTILQGVPVLLLPAILLLVIVGGRAWVFKHSDNDAEGASLQKGTAQVVNKASEYTKTGMSIQWTFRIHERTFVTPTSGDDERLLWTHIGDTVLVTYHVGKSGAIYIEDWQAPHKMALPR